MKKLAMYVALIGLGAYFAAGCAITDYTGLGLHATSGEAKLWGTEIAFDGFDPAVDGTYSYTVKYDNTDGLGAVTINSYRNPVVASFSRDGVVDRDGDFIQGRAGTLGGKFLPFVKAVDYDQTPGACGFFDNITFNKSGGDAGTDPAVALCQGTSEEIDKDLDLQAPVASLDDLFANIWSGALRGNFSLEITALILNGRTIPVETYSIYASAGPLRIGGFVVDGSQPSTVALIEAVLANTSHMQPNTLGLVFDGGLRFHLPGGTQVAFNHDALWALLEN